MRFSLDLIVSDRPCDIGRLARICAAVLIARVGEEQANVDSLSLGLPVPNQVHQSVRRTDGNRAQRPPHQR